MPRPVTDKNRLSINHPDLPAYIDPELNGGLTNDDVASKSNIDYKWRCYAAGHVFLRKPNVATKKRRKGSYPRCPECITLAFHNPDIAVQWHPSKNGTLTPDKVTYGSATKRWWICCAPECPVVGGHEWQDTVAHRTGGGRGCPACAGKVVTDDNRLSMTHPKIAAQWHPTKNGDLTPDDVSHGSSKPGKIWWKCDNPECPVSGGHEWDQYVSARTNMDSGCPACAGKVPTDRNRLTIHHSSVAAEWIRCLDCDKPADEHPSGSNHRVLWKCDSPKCPVVGGHEWEVGIADRTISSKGKGTGCPACAGKVATDDNWLANHPQIAAMVLPWLNNGQRAYDIAESSNKRLNLKCANGHEFKRSPNGMIHKQADGTWKYTDCRACNTLGFCYSHLIPEWDYENNNGKTPYDVSKHSPRKAAWVCRECKHRWSAVIASRTQQGTGCPACSGHVPTDKNRLTIHRPVVAKEWVKCLNCAFPASEHTCGSNHRALWRCNRMHEWDAVISSRSAGTGCSKCNPQRSKREIRIACELAYIFPDMSPTDTVSLHPTDKRKLICDIYSPAHKLVIEYDGAYWHQDKAETDIEKTRQLEALGYEVLRLREAGLGLLPNVHNIACNIDYYRTESGIKAVVDDALRYIAAEFGISNANTEAYLARDGLANAELAETIIANDGESQLPLFYVMLNR